MFITQFVVLNYLVVSCLEAVINNRLIQVAVAEGPRDALSQLKSCQVMHTLLFQRWQVSHARGNSMKLSKHHVSSRRDGHFFANRVINIWNSLPDHIVASPVACFKRKLSKFHFNE